MSDTVRASGRVRDDLAETSADRVRAELEGVLAEERPIHDLYGDMAASMLTFIAQELGEEAVERAWRHVGEDVWRPFLDQFRAGGDTAGLARAFAYSLISHRYDFEAVEHDDRWSFEVGYCTSGERMVAEGKVAGVARDRPGPHCFGATTHAHPWTLGLERFPYYDVHSALWMKLLPAEWGWDVMDVEYEHNEELGEPTVARYIIYKQPRDG
jgi:hypothetical protein